MAFPIEQQLESYWCWDAVTVSVEHYFNASSQLTQQEFAVQALGVPLAQADQPYYLQEALSDLDLLSEYLQGSYLTFEEIQQQLATGLPIGVHIAWNEGGSHYVLITGYGTSPGGNPQVYVSDPMLGDSNVVAWDYDSFVLAYDPNYAQSAEGAWVDTCLLHAGVKGA
jgi:Papain-like cysteine protease AvrRpt2